MPDVTVKKGESLDLFSLPDFTAGTDVLTVINKSVHDCFLTSDASPPNSLQFGAPLRKYGVGSTEAGDANAWVSAPFGTVVLSVNP